MKKSLIILRTKNHVETIHTDDPNGEINRLILLHNKDVISIILDNKVIYTKTKNE